MNKEKSRTPANENKVRVRPDPASKFVPVNQEKSMHTKLKAIIAKSAAKRYGPQPVKSVLVKHAKAVSAKKAAQVASNAKITLSAVYKDAAKPVVVPMPNVTTR